MPDKPKAFILMPFSDSFNTIYHDIINPPLEAAGYEVSRADSFIHQREILNDIVENIANAKLVVADLTGLNANVMYEVGLSHGLGTPTVLITQSIESLPFDLRGYRTLEYPIYPSEASDFCAKLQDLAERHKNNSVIFESPATQVLKTKQGQQTSKEVLKTEQNMAMSRVQLDKNAADAAFALNAMFIEFASYIKQLAAQTMKSVEELAPLLSVNEHDKRIKQTGEILERDAETMNGLYYDMEKMIPEFERNTYIAIDNYTALIDLANPAVTEDRELLQGYIPVFSNWLNSVSDLLEKLLDFRNVIGQLQMGMNRNFDRSARQVMQAVNHLIPPLEQMESFCTRMIRTIQQKLESDPPRPQ